jgi:hypothetical protein
MSEANQSPTTGGISPAADQRPTPSPRPHPTPVKRPTITGEQFTKIVARINASSSLPPDAKKEIITLVAALYGFPIPGH